MNFPFQWSDMLVSWRVLNVSIFLRGSSNAVYVKFLRDFQEKHRALFGLAINIRASVCVWSGIDQLGILLGGYVGDEHNYFGVILGMNTTTYHNYFRVILGEVVCLRFPLLFLKMYHGSTKWRHLCKGYIYIYIFICLPFLQEKYSQSVDHPRKRACWRIHNWNDSKYTIQTHYP